MVTFFSALLTIGGASFLAMAGAYGLAGLLGPTWGRISTIVILNLVLVMVLATFLTTAERKWSAMIQNRIGPNRIRVKLPWGGSTALWGLPFLIPDVVKLLTKEAFTPRSASPLLFKIAPMLAFAPAFILFVIVPVGPTVLVNGTYVKMVGADPDFGLLFFFAIASLAVYGTSLAGWSSNSKFALLGGVRASSQMISYEVALGLSLVGMMLAFGTVALAGDGGMAVMQSKYLWHGTIGGVDVGIPQWGIVLQPVGFFMFFAAAFAETKRAPFDTPEGESEIIGYFVEYSGMQFGMFMISEFVEVVVLSGILVAVFFGGWSLPFGNELIQNLTVMKDHPWLLGAVFGMIFWFKVVFFCAVQLTIRWTFPRFRYDHIQRLGWEILLPLGLANVFISGALVLWDPQLHALAAVGFVELGILTFFVVTPPAQVRRAASHDRSHDGDAPPLHAARGGPHVVAP